MLWRPGRIYFLSACLESTATQEMNADHIGEHKLTSPAQSRAALGIFVPFSGWQQRCRSPPRLRFENLTLTNFQSEEKQCNSL